MKIYTLSARVVLSRPGGSRERLISSMKEETADKKGKKRLSRRATTILLFVLLFVGLSVLLYPTVADWWNSRTQTRAIAMYEDTVDEISAAQREQMLEEAEQYNEAIYEVGSAAAITDPDIVSGYWETLDITGTGIMGYVTIDRINVNLPIYHGTEASVLQTGAGHLQGTTLPIGGESRHCVISAHRGLPSARLFTDLDKLEVGDTFTVKVLDQTYTYEVDKISIILPDEIEYIYIEDGEDYLTLMTCTPYGINTHRLLVRGTRIDNIEGLNITPDADQINALVVAPFIAAPMLLALLIWLLVSTRKRKKQDAAGESSQDTLPGGNTGSSKQETRTRKAAGGDTNKRNGGGHPHEKTQK